MQKRRIFIAALTFKIVFMAGSVCLGQVLENNSQQGKPANSSSLHKGTAVVITGAASRIPQEAALLEQLCESGWLNDVAFISGASSGALNTVVLNAILNKTFSWERYKKILFGITNSQVYERGDKKLPLNTQPLGNLLRRIVQDTLGYSVIGDLPFPSAMSATRIKLVPPEKQTMRFSNKLINAESNPAYNLVDVLMASAAIPLVFPPVRIRNVDDFPEETFLDGGISDDHIPFEAVLQYQRLRGNEVERLIIVSRKSDSVQNIQDELASIGLKDSKVLEKLGITLQRYSKDSFVKKLLELQQLYPALALRTYIYVPDFDSNYPLLNFNTMKDQYRVTSAWAKQNQPVLLSEYLRENKVPKE